MRILKSGSFENLFKMADVRVTPEELARMREEGIHMITDRDIAEPNVMQGVSNRKTDIKNLVGTIALPRIMYPTMDDIIELDGRQYYVVFIAAPQARKNPEGTVYMIDVQTGESVKRPFLQMAERLKSVRADNLRASAEQVNSLIKKWNTAIDKMGKIVNPTTWPLQLNWANKVVDERLEELNAQEQAIMSKLDQSTNFSPSFTQLLERLKADLVAGTVPNEDVYDTIMFIQHNDPDALDAILSNPSTSEEVKSKINALVGIRKEEVEKAKSKAETDEGLRQERIEAPADIEGMLSPGQQELIRIDEKDVEEYAGKKPRMPDRYFGPQGRTSQMRKTLEGIRKNKELVNGAKEALDNLREFIGRLEKGERAKSILMGTERGTEIKRQIAQFIHKAKSFIRSYKTPVFVKNEDTGTYDLNKKLLGTTGGPGNAKVAVVINHMLSVVTSGLKAYASPTAVQEEGEPEGEVDLSEVFDVSDVSVLPQDLP